MGDAAAPTDSDRIVVHSFLALVQFFCANVLGVFLFGTNWVAVLWQARPAMLFMGAPLLVSVILAVLLPRAGRSSQALAISFVGLAVVTFAVPQWGRGFLFMPSPGSPYLWPMLRFAVVPIFSLASAVAVLVAPRGPAERQRMRRIGRVLFVVHTAVVTIACFHVKNFRSAGPAWPATVARTYREQCAHATPDTIVSLDTSVAHWWFPVRLRCQQLGP